MKSPGDILRPLSPLKEPMAPSKNREFDSTSDDWVDDAEETAELDDPEIDDAEFDVEEVEEEELETLDEEIAAGAVVAPEVETEDEGEALDELEAEELDMLTADEEAEILPVDEAEEIRKLRREAIELDAPAETAGKGEFVCQNCFLVKRTSQLADKRRKLCRDCV